MQEVATPILIEDLGHLLPKETSKQTRLYGMYQCPYCNIHFKAMTSNIRRGTTLSCGCYQKHVVSACNSSHRMVNHSIYRVWGGMLGRCTNLKNKSYEHYGERGIGVCERWKSFENFRDDMFPTWKEGLSIDRINNDLGYSPENCRWASLNIQARNKQMLMKNNTSGYRGVSFSRATNTWKTSIGVNGKRIHLGFFENRKLAALAYNTYVVTNGLEHTLNIIKD